YTSPHRSPPPHLIFFLLTRRPPSSTLFPYTTLFRSRGSKSAQGASSESRITSHESRRLQSAEHVAMQNLIGGQNRRRLETDRLAFEIAEFPASGFDDDRKGGDVEDVHVGFDDDVDLARRQQMVVQEIAIAANAARARDELSVGTPLRSAGQCLQVACRNRACLDRIDVAHANRAVVQDRALAADCRL